MIFYYYSFSHFFKDKSIHIIYIPHECKCCISSVKYIYTSKFGNKNKFQYILFNNVGFVILEGAFQVVQRNNAVTVRFERVFCNTVLSSFYNGQIGTHSSTCPSCKASETICKVSLEALYNLKDNTHSF